MLKRSLKYGDYNQDGNYVVYLITREYRAQNNWALLEAVNLAMSSNKKLFVVVLIDREKDLVNEKQLPILINGITKLEIELFKKNIPMIFLDQLSIKEFSKLIGFDKLFHLYTDFNPLKKVRKFINDVTQLIGVTVVDAHNIVPCFVASEKLEYGAYTLRPKIVRLLSNYMTEYPELPEFDPLNKNIEFVNYINYKSAERGIIKGGYFEALNVLDHFIKNKLQDYSEKRNDPNEDKNSNLSPYLHFGFISSQEVVLKTETIEVEAESKEAFFEELIVRKELSDNFCFFNENYDSMNSFPAWALDTLHKHRNDRREYLYDFDKFQSAETHDELWNAAQNQLLGEGRIHGYMRMYWAKKILEWTDNPETAFDYALRLNDLHAIDGIDPNGYTGVAWSIGGVHDRAWKEREVYGKIRYMNSNGCKRKFDVTKYIERYNG